MIDWRQEVREMKTSYYVNKYGMSDESAEDMVAREKEWLDKFNFECGQTKAKLQARIFWDKKRKEAEKIGRK